MAAAGEQDGAAIRRRHLWRAEAAIGTLIRTALARAGVDAAQATRLCLAEEAAASLAALPDALESERTDDDSPAAAEARDLAGGDALMPKILAMAAGFAGMPPPDFANASFAELFAWSLAPPPAK